MNVYELVVQAAQKWPENNAVFDEPAALTFSDLYTQTETIRKKLIELGVGKGTGIGIMARNSSNFIITMLAGVGCNAVVLPISHQLKSAEINDIIETAGLHAIIDDQSGVNPLSGKQEIIFTSLGNLRFGWTGNNREIPIAPHVPDAAFIRFTSGTTGKSKGVIVSHQSTIERIEAANKALQLGPKDTVIWVLPMAYHFLVSIILYLRFGAAIAICKDFLANTIIELTNKHKGTLLYASPMHIRLLASEQSKRQLPSLTKVISTSTAISIQFCQAFKNRFGMDVSQAYGIIEIGLPIINFKKSSDNPAAVGYALPDYKVEILDEKYEILPAESTGKLAIQGPGMFDAYLSPPEMRKDILKNNWFLTGDLALKSKDGLITICGREKSMINVSGNKVFPEEVEHLLNAHPKVQACKVSGITHLLMGEIVQAKIVLYSNMEITEEELLHYCRQNLSTYKVPQSIEFVNQLDLTASGKIKRDT